MTKKTANQKIRSAVFLATLLSLATGAGCSTLRSMFALEENKGKLPPIANPFGTEFLANAHNDNVILRTKKGDRSIEVELPSNHGDLSDFVMPMSPSFRDSRSPASAGEGSEESAQNMYADRAPGSTDREIAQGLPKVMADDNPDRREIEAGLGVMSSEDPGPAREKSYLGAIDRVKQLYKSARFEAALIELDEMLRAYPTDPKLHTMKGTLLDRIGRTDLAVKSWTQALRFDPGNQSLKKYLDRKQHQRKLASP